MSSLEVVFLGTGGPLPSADRCGAGAVLVAGRTHVLVDCGWGSARRLIPSGIRPAQIDTAIFTHMHSDHITDLPDFLFLRWVTGATTPLRVYGPEGTQEMVDGFLMAMRRDIGFRKAHHGDGLHSDGIKVETIEVTAGKSVIEFLNLDGLRIEAFEVDHFPVVPAFGYRATYEGCSVVFSGDTSKCDSLVEASRGIDMLVCEALNLTMLERTISAIKPNAPLQAGNLEDVPSYHISTLEVAELARDAKVGEVVLSHIIPTIASDDAIEAQFVQGMSEIYDGSIRIARDTQRLTVKGAN
jgi:ribonuclease Z